MFNTKIYHIFVKKKKRGREKSINYECISFITSWWNTQHELTAKEKKTPCKQTTRVFSLVTHVRASSNNTSLIHSTEQLMLWNETLPPTMIREREREGKKIQRNFFYSLTPKNIRLLKLSLFYLTALTNRTCYKSIFI